MSLIRLYVYPFVSMFVPEVTMSCCDVARRRYASPVVTVSLLAKFYPIFWYVRPMYDENR